MNTMRIENMVFGFPNKILGKVGHLELQSGGIHLLLGKNGVGKSTFMKSLAGIHATLKLDSLQVNGQEFRKSPTRPLISYSNRVDVRARLSVMQFLEIALALRPQELKKRIEENADIVDKLGLSRVMSQSLKHLSDGERQKLNLALQVFREGTVLLLDEPLSHLDPLASQEILEILYKLAKEKIIFLSSHHPAQVSIDYLASCSALFSNQSVQKIDLSMLEDQNLLRAIYM